MQKFWIFLLFIIILGCTWKRPPPPDEPPPPPPPDSSVLFTCAVRPVFITSGGQTDWTDELFNPRIAVVNHIFEPVRLRFNFLPIEHLESPILYELNQDDEWDDLAVLSKFHAEERREIAVYFVKNIRSGSSFYGGLASLPSNQQDSIFQHGVAISISSTLNVVAHELGHVFNLRHTWADNHTDTPSSGPQDCDVPAKYCNLMSYCSPGLTGVGCSSIRFSKEQITEGRYWCIVPPRSVVVNSGMVTTSRLPPYTDTTKPVVD
jgi:hypothetical protein